MELFEKANGSFRNMLRDCDLDGVRDAFTSFLASIPYEANKDERAKEALQQIEEKQYALPYLEDQRKLHRIGVNISSESRTVDEWLVEE